MPRRPPAGIIPAGHDTLPHLWLSRQVKAQAFRHIKDLIAVLHTVAPHILEDQRFLERSVLLDGVPATISPRDLSQGILGVEMAVLVRDIQTGFRIGLVVFFDSADSETVTSLPPRRGLYATCTPANRHGEISRNSILDAVGDSSARICEARVFRFLLPAQYMVDDEDRELHLRCALVGAVGGIGVGGAYTLSRLGWDVLLARGYLLAVIVHGDDDAGVLVYDDTEATEVVARRAPQLLHKAGLELYDSSLFPLAADSADRDASLLRRLLPAYVTDDEEKYRCRVLLLTGLDTQDCDAAEVAYFVQLRLNLAHDIEAVIIHRAERIVLVVLGSSSDMVRAVEEPDETWIQFFGQRPGCVSVFGCTTVKSSGGSDHDSAASDVCSESEQQSVRRGVMYWAGTEAFERLRNWMSEEVLKLSDSETIVPWLIRVCALAYPDFVLRSGFPERSLLLSGVAHGTTWSDLWIRLSTFGVLEDVVVDYKRLVSLVVFRSWHGAARLLREPHGTWARLGFLECRRVPDAEHAGVFAEEVVDWLLQYHRLCTTSPEGDQLCEPS